MALKKRRIFRPPAHGVGIISLGPAPSPARPLAATMLGPARPTSSAAPTGLTPAQIAALSPGNLQKIAGSGIHNLPSDPFGWIGKLAPYFKIAAGGLGLMVSGVTLVFIVGRKTPVAGVAAAVAGGPAGAAARAATAPATERRGALRSEVRAQRAKGAREEARSRVETRVSPSGRERVRTVSRKEGAGRRQDEARAESERSEQRQEQNRANLAALKARRSSSGTRRKVSA